MPNFGYRISTVPLGGDVLDFAELRCDDAPVTDEQWEAGARIQRARGTMSIREAARRAGISEARWRHIEKGYQPIGGHQVPVNPRTENVVAIAKAVGMDPAELFRIMGRDDYREMVDVEVPGEGGETIVVTFVVKGRLSPEERRRVEAAARGAGEAVMAMESEELGPNGR